MGTWVKTVKCLIVWLSNWRVLSAITLHNVHYLGTKKANSHSFHPAALCFQPSPKESKQTHISINVNDQTFRGFSSRTTVINVDVSAFRGFISCTKAINVNIVMSYEARFRGLSMICSFISILSSFSFLRIIGSYKSHQHLINHIN